MSTAPRTAPGPPAAACCAPSAGLDPALPADGIAAVAGALASPVRVRILDVLRRSREPVCQCELLALLDVSQPNLSHHMRALSRAGLVEVERRHRWAYYSPAPDALEDLITWLS
jgi:ArsR family transcriptional regulator